MAKSREYIKSIIMVDRMCILMDIMLRLLLIMEKGWLGGDESTGVFL